jgi:hypothetical protein
MAEIVCEEQSEAAADSVNGEVTSAPLAGLFTVMLATAGEAKLASRIARREEILRICIQSPGGGVVVRLGRPKTGAVFLAPEPGQK